jgi:dTDP-glucose 4,6-dehydratase
MATIFVTGGAGFIGSNFIRYWLTEHQDDTVINYDLLTYAGNQTSLADVAKQHPQRYRFVRGDIADYYLVRYLLDEWQPAAIINFAAESHNSRAVLEPSVFFQTNVLGTQRLLDAARDAGVGRFHHISTCEVYGDLALEGDRAFTEESPYRPRTPYNASKAAADLAVRAYADTFGLPATISNCANNYGPYQFPEKVIPVFAIRALDGEKLPLYRSSQHRREWLHVEDHCRAIDTILQHGRLGETYNVGSGVELDVEAVADLVLDSVGLDASFKSYVQDRPGHDRRYRLDSSKLHTELGWSPKVPVDQGIRVTVKWYRENRWWWQPLLAKRVVNEETWK